MLIAGMAPFGSSDTWKGHSHPRLCTSRNCSNRPQNTPTWSTRIPSTTAVLYAGVHAVLEFQHTARRRSLPLTLHAMADLHRPAHECILLRQLLSGLPFPSKPTPLFCDNNEAFGLADHVWPSHVGH